MRRILSGIKGYSLLETSLAIVISGSMVIGTLDVTRIFNGYAALQEGMSEASRCLMTTDECYDSSVESEALYRVSHRKSPYEWPVQYYDYSGTAEWIEPVKYRLTDFEATVLDSVTIDIHPGQYRKIVTGLILDQRKPFIDLGAPSRNGGSFTIDESAQLKNFLRAASMNRSSLGGSLIGPVAKFKKADGSAYKAAVNKSYSAALKQGSNASRTEVIAIDLPGYNAAHSGYECAEGATCLKTFAPAVIYVEGTVSGSGGGSVSLFYKTGSGSWRPLGGRRLEASLKEGDAVNFVPRGVKKEKFSAVGNYIEPDQGYNDDGTEADGIGVDLNGPLKLKVKLSEAGNDRAWILKRIKVFLPVYKTTEVESLHCEGESALKAGAGELYEDRSFDTRIELVPGGVCHQITSKEYYDCKDNFGIAEAAEEKDKLELCLKPEEIEIISRNYTKAVFRTMAKKDFTDYEHNPVDCASEKGEGLNIEDLKSHEIYKYKEASPRWKVVKETGAPVFTENISVRKYKKLNKWNCDSFPELTRRFDYKGYESGLTGLQKRSDFSGKKLQICKNEAETLKREALEIEADKISTGNENWIVSEGKGALESGAFFSYEKETDPLVWVPGSPAHECYSGKKRLVDSDKGYIPFPGLFSKDSIPEECTKGTYQCKQELMSLGVTKKEIDIEKAIELAENKYSAAVNAISPSSSGENRKGEKMSEIEIRRVENGSLIEYSSRGTVRVPLLILGNKEVTLRESNGTSWEGNYAE